MKKSDAPFFVTINTMMNLPLFCSCKSVNQTIFYSPDSFVKGFKQFHPASQQLFI